MPIDEKTIDFYDKDPIYDYTRKEIIKILESGEVPMQTIQSLQWYKDRLKNKKGGSVKASKYSKGGGVRSSKYKL
jgi:hypothetical protein